MNTIDDYKMALHIAKRDLKAFEAALRKLGGSYRNERGEYSPALYDRHIRLAETVDGLKRTLASMRQQAKLRKAGKI